MDQEKTLTNAEYLDLVIETTRNFLGILDLEISSGVKNQTMTEVDMAEMVIARSIAGTLQARAREFQGKLLVPSPKLVGPDGTPLQ